MRLLTMTSPATLHKLAIASRALPVWLRYLMTTGAVAGVYGLTRGPAVDEVLRPMIYLAVVLLAGALLDRGNGLYATGLTALLMTAVEGRNLQGGVWEVAAFVVLGVVISLVVEALHYGLVAISVEHKIATDAARDRQVLLNELSHRTRNDFANLATLLNLQARASNEVTAAALRMAVDRVQAVARVHRKLTLSGDRVVVDSKAYIDDLCENLQQTLGTARPICISWQAESYQLALRKAVPIGLILNEAVTNALKHAFPDERSGNIAIIFTRAENLYELSVADDGIGLSSAPSPLKGKLGHQLIELLAAQLGGKASVARADASGTVVRVTFPRNLEQN